MMELTHLRTFVAVAELEHLTQAAERLHLSQPAASAHIKALEEALRVPLFERRATGLALTPAGRVLLGFARQVLTAASTLESKAREIARTVAGRFRLGTRVDPGLIPLGDLVRATRERYPKLELDIHQLNSLNILSGVQSGELDAGFALADRLPQGILQATGSRGEVSYLRLTAGLIRSPTDLIHLIRLARRYAAALRALRALAAQGLGAP